MKKIVNILILSLICSYISACKDGGSGGSSNPVDQSCQECGDYIPNNKSDLGEIAQFLVENEPTIDHFYNGTVEWGNQGTVRYPDYEVLRSIRAYIHGLSKGVDHNGAMDVLSESDKFLAFYESVYVGDSASRGLTNEGLAHMTCEVLRSFGIESSVIVGNGPIHSKHAPDGKLYLVEAHLPNADILFNTYANRSFKLAQAFDDNLTVDELSQVTYEEGQYGADSVYSHTFDGRPDVSFHRYGDFKNSLWMPYHSNSRESASEYWEVMIQSLQDFERIPYSQLRD